MRIRFLTMTMMMSGKQTRLKEYSDQILHHWSRAARLAK